MIITIKGERLNLSSDPSKGNGSINRPTHQGGTVNNLPDPSKWNGPPIIAITLLIASIMLTAAIPTKVPPIIHTHTPLTRPPLQPFCTNPSFYSFLADRLKGHRGGNPPFPIAMTSSYCMFYGLGRNIQNAQKFDRTAVMFIQKYMAQLSKYDRKTIAYDGAIRAYHDDHPCHYMSSVLGPTFHPGNRIYALALQMMFPSLKDLGYNDCTLGEICKGFLALGLRKHPSRHPAALSLARMIEAVAGDLYVLCCRFNLYYEEDIRNQWQLVLREEQARYYGTPSERPDPPMPKKLRRSGYHDADNKESSYERID